MAGVQVTFGANIQQLVDGVDSIRDKLTHLAEAVGVAFSIEGIKSFTEKMADLGERTEITGAILGVSNAQVVALSGFAALGGESMEDMGSHLQRAALNLQRSTRDGVNPAAQALSVLHINARQLIGVPADEFFLRLSDAVSQFRPSLNLTTAVTQAFGRGVAALMPLLLQGRERVEEFQRAWQQASQGLAAAVPGMADTHEKILLLDQSAMSFGARLFTVFKPAIDAVITSVTGWLQKMDASTIARFVTQAVGYIEQLAISTIVFFSGSKQTVDDFLKSLKDMWAYITSPPSVTIDEGSVASWVRDHLIKPLEAGIAQANAVRAALANSKDRVDAGFDALDSGIKTKGKTLADSAHDVFEQLKTQIAAGMAALGSAGPSKLGGLLDAGATNNAAASQVAANIEAINAMVAAQDRYYAQQAEHINATAKTFGISEAQKTSELIAQVNTREAMETNEIQMGLQLQGLTQAQYQKFQDELTKTQQKADADRQKIEDQAVEAYQKQWESTLNTITGAFNSQLRGLLAGTTTWRQAWQKMLGDMIIKFIEMCEQVLVKWVSLEASKTAATLTGNAARTASDQSATVSSSLADLGNIMKSVFGFAGQTSAAVSANVAPVVGPAAPAIGAAAGASVLATAEGYMGSFDIGSWQLPRTGLATVHRNEMIVPGSFADGLRGALTGGGRGGAGGSAGVTRSDMRGMLSDHRNEMSQMMAMHRSAMGGLESAIQGLQRKLR